MNQIRFYFLLTGMLLFSGCIGVESGRTGEEWVKTSYIRTPDINVHVIGTCHQDTLFIGGQTREHKNGLVFYQTSDSGATWKKGATLPDGYYFSDRSVVVKNGQCWGVVQTKVLGGDKYAFRYDARKDTILISDFHKDMLSVQFWPGDDAYYSILENGKSRLVRIKQDLSGFDYVRELPRTLSSPKLLIDGICYVKNTYTPDYTSSELYVENGGSVNLGENIIQDILFTTDSTCIFWSTKKETDAEYLSVYEYNVKTETNNLLSVFDSYDFLKPVMIDGDNIVLIADNFGPIFLDMTILYSPDRGKTWRSKKMPLSASEMYLDGKRLYVDGVTTIDIYDFNFLDR